ncbi:uncharacterized protein LOC122255853 [Penaeus japonicus]|uniref:uncharacterized protein LOC122255853 n=1 Tax=Penaeus japonicus TaxID=27405 RepID=UPI001C71701E|nr:uncharacterized protein LOC122255853 [Penaeus japonicus]
MARPSHVGLLVALVLGTLVASVTSLSVSEKSLSSVKLEAQLDDPVESEIVLNVNKRHAEMHHVAKREANTHSISKRQSSVTSRLETLQFRSALMFIEADQASDVTVAVELAEVFEQINKTLQSGQATNNRADAFERQLQSIAANVSANSVLPKNCGRSPSDSGDVLRGSHPWVVSVGFKQGDGATIGCAGVVISRYHVITSGSCAATTKYDHVLLKGTQQRIANRWVHPTLTSDDDLNNGHNIGILMTAEPLFFNDEVQPACLPGILDTVNPISESTTTLVGFEDAVGGGVRSYAWVNSKTLGSLLCFESLRALRSSRPSTLIDVLTRHHLCVLRPFDEAEISVAVDQNPRTGRVQVTGVGPVVDPNSNIPMAFTLTQTHLFWLELMVKNSIRLLV